MLTAGHCVIANRVAAKRIEFVPAYDHGKRPFGTFSVEVRLRDAAMAAPRKP